MQSLEFVPMHFLQLEWQFIHRDDIIICPSSVHEEQISVLEFCRLQEISGCLK